MWRGQPSLLLRQLWRAQLVHALLPGPLHVPQEAEQGWQWRSVSAYMPAGQASMHAPLSRKAPPPNGRQLVQLVLPAAEHSTHDGSHDWQTPCWSAYIPTPQEATQRPPSKNGAPPTQPVQSASPKPEHVRQCSVS